jgi:CheY-like chemotaxis protein
MSKILIADDSRFQITMLTKSLEENGFEVVSALDALQAWMIALRTAPDAIVLDINMPGGSGIEVLRRLRVSTKTQHIPVIVLSGSKDLSVEQVAKDLGAVQFLHKPIDPLQLCAAFSRLLSPAN